MSTAPTTRCVFCGGEPVIYQHLLPKWVRALLPKMVGGQARLTDDATHEQVEFPIASVAPKVACACTTCYAGWIAELDALVAPLLSDSVQVGGPMLLDVGQQALVARWAVKHAMLLDYLGPGPRLIPTHHLPWFHEHQTPLPHTSVWLGRYGLPEPDQPDGSASFRGMWMKNRAAQYDLSFGQLDAYWTTYTVGFLVCQVHTVLVPDGFPQFKRGTKGESALLHIWPTVDRLLTYPPRLGLGEAALDMFGECQGDAAVRFRRYPATLTES